MDADNLGYDVFDADNHYYEAIDAFTRHLDPKQGPRVVQWCEIDGRKYHVIGGRVSHAVVNPTFDPVAKAGALHDYFRGNPEGKNPVEMLREREPIRPEYRDRDVRLQVMDQQGLEKIWLFPTLGILYEELLKHDIEAVTMMCTAFNRWLEDDWGCNYQDRIYSSPVPLAVRRRLGGQGARVGTRARRAHDRAATRCSARPRPGSARPPTRCSTPSGRA